MKRRLSEATTVFTMLWLTTSRVIAHDRGWAIPVGSRRLPWTILRGGDQEELTLDQKVYKAMQKLGISPPPPPPPAEQQAKYEANAVEECVDGVCPMPAPTETSTSTSVTEKTQEEVGIIANRIAQELQVDESLARAALGATSTADGEDRIYNESSARAMIQQELDMIARISEDSEEVKQLVSEGFDTFFSRRALAFAEGNMDDARAILLADKMDEEEEEAERRQQEKQPMGLATKTVAVDANFNPTKLDAPAKTASPGAPTPAKKEDVVFDVTASQIQELVLESPVPVLLDVYADWCGPCKALTPVLEEMAVKSGGAFRLVKVNSDNEQAVSGALEVTALPTVFGVRDGKILHMFQGMPRSEEAMKNFMMGLLIPGEKFEPPVTASQQEKYNELSLKLLKTASGASFPFSARERLYDRVMAKLDDLTTESGDVLNAEAAARTIRSLLSNVIRNPYETKFRTVNLSNKVIAEKVAKYPTAVGILKSVGFVLDSGSQLMTIGKGKKIINVAPLLVARDCIDKWIDKMRYEVARAARHKQDLEDRLRLQAEAAAAGEADGDEMEMEEDEEVDANECTLKLRMDGKKKVHDIQLRADDPLSAVLDKLPVAVEEEQEVQITCVSKRLVVKSSEKAVMSKTLRDLGLAPTAAIVVSVGSKESVAPDSSPLSKRAAAQKKKKKGSHTMQSVGIYAKDDNAKAELIDGGGGVWYEHDVSDEEAEEEAEQNEDEIEDQAEENDED